MSQTRIQSLVETLVGTAVAFGITVAASEFIYPYFGHKFTTGDNAKIAVVFTIISVVRSYIVRRSFNRLHEWQTRRRK